MVLDSGRYQISLLRQPVEADFCNQETKQQPQRYRRNRQKNALTKDQINLYDSKDNTLRVFFTGLYTPKTYQGLKNGLYFVGNSSNGFSVMTRKEIHEASEFDGNEVLKHITRSKLGFD